MLYERRHTNSGFLGPLAIEATCHITSIKSKDPQSRVLLTIFIRMDFHRVSILSNSQCIDCISKPQVPS